MRRISAYLIAFLSIAGCQREMAVEGTLETHSFRASIDADETRTTLQNGSVLWSPEDRVAVFRGSFSILEYSVKPGTEGSSSAILVESGSNVFHQASAINANLAFFPFSYVTGCYNSQNPFKIKIKVPDTQNYVPGTFDEEVFPMVAVTRNSQDYELPFRNLFGLLKLSLTGNGLKLKAVSISGNNGEPLAGPATVVCNYSSSPSVSFNSGALQTMILDCGEGVTLGKDQATEFLIALPPVNFSKGITAVFSTDARDITVSTTSPLAITRSNVKPMDVLELFKEEVSLSWSASSADVVVGAENEYPSLSVSPDDFGGLIKYSSSDISVATIDSLTGKVEPIADGTATITAAFAGDADRAPASASYVLNVSTTFGTGKGSYEYASTGDPSSSDDISGTTFNRLIRISWTTKGVRVIGDGNGIVTVEGDYVTANNTGKEFIVYELTGSTSSGGFTLYSDRKQAILLNDVSIFNPYGAAVNNQSGKRTFVMVEGENHLGDGPSASYGTSADEDMKAVFFSEGQLVFSGGGSLTVNSYNRIGKACITSDDYVRVMADPYITVVSGASAGNGIKGKDYVRLSGGYVTATIAGDTRKAIISDEYVLVEGGTHNLTVNGGTAYDSEDKEYKGSVGIKADNYFGMTGGYVKIVNTGDGGKGVQAGSLDYFNANGGLTDSFISGGFLDISTTGKEVNGESAKGMKIGWAVKKYNVSYAGGLLISGGSVNISSSGGEGLEVKGDLTISGGEVSVFSDYDDAINSQAEMVITGGVVYAHSTKDDALDANHNVRLSGGYVYAITETNRAMAVDANTEEGYRLYIEEGVTLVTCGNLERGFSSAQRIYSLTGHPGAWNALQGPDGFIMAFYAPAKFSQFFVSAPSLTGARAGVSVGNAAVCNGMVNFSRISGGSSASLVLYSGNGGGPGGGF